MGFPVFANQLRSADPTEVDGFDFVQQLLHLIAHVPVGDLQLPLRETLQEAAASFAVGFRTGVDTLEQRIGD